MLLMNFSVESPARRQWTGLVIFIEEGGSHLSGWLLFESGGWLEDLKIGFNFTFIRISTSFRPLINIYDHQTIGVFN